MPSAKLVRRLWAGGVFALPVVAVKIAAIMMGSDAPQHASATPAENPAIGATSRPAIIKHTEQQLAAAAYVASFRSLPFGSNPLLYPEEPKHVIVDDPDPEPIQVDPPEEKEPEVAFVLNAVMSGSRGKTALVDGRPYREGDRIKGSEWDVKSIDCDNRQVTLFNPTRGRTMVVRVETPLNSDDQTGTSAN